MSPVQFQNQILGSAQGRVRLPPTFITVTLSSRIFMLNVHVRTNRCVFFCPVNILATSRTFDASCTYRYKALKESASCQRARPKTASVEHHIARFPIMSAHDYV